MKSEHYEYTYTARFVVSNEVIYANRRAGNLFGELPLGSTVYRDGGSLNRKDGGDPWESALWVTPSGSEIIVTRDAFERCMCSRSSKHVSFQCARNAIDGHRVYKHICRKCSRDQCGGKHGASAT